MRVSYQGRPQSHADACRVLEGIAEGAVRAMKAEIELNPDAQPCCIGCGKFVIRNGPMFPAQPQSLQAIMAERGIEDEDILRELHGSSPPSELRHDPTADVQIRCVRDIALRKGGTTLELACYQAAQRRRRGDDPECVVIVTAGDSCGGPGPAFRAAVFNSDEHYMDDKAMTLDCPVERLGPGDCTCKVVQ